MYVCADSVANAAAVVGGPELVIEHASRQQSFAGDHS
jgi:hypothetical protein